MVWRFLLLVFFVIAICGGCTPVPKNGESKLAEMRVMARELPTFPDFRKIDEYGGAKVSQANIGWVYKSSAEYEDVKQFYMERLASSGWYFVSENKKAIWFYDSGARTVTFQKSDIRLAIEFNGRSRYSVDLYYPTTLVAN